MKPSVQVLPPVRPGKLKPASDAQRDWLESEAQILLGGGSLGSLKTSTAIVDGSVEFDNSNMHTIMFRKALKMWQQELPPEQFVRVHRQAIIYLGFIDYVEKAGEGRLQIHLRDFKPAIFVSQRETPDFNRCLKHFQARAAVSS